MATSRVYLAGGPCNGRTVSASRIQGGPVGYILCQGHYYVADGTTRPNGNAVFRDTGTKPPQETGGGGSSGTVGAPQALGGWQSLRQAVNRGLPEALRKKNRLQQAALRELAQKRRVGR